MRLYHIVLFLHVAGAIATFVGVTAWFFGVVALRRARLVEEVRTIALIYRMGGVVGLTGILVVAIAGLYLANSAWSFGIGWIQVSIGAFVLLAPVGPFVVAPRLERSMREVRTAGDGPLPPAVLVRLRSPVLKLALLVIVGDLVGIVFLMSVKPSFSGSIVAILVSIGLGAALGLLPVGRAVLAAVDSFAKVEESNPFYR